MRRFLYRSVSFSLVTAALYFSVLLLLANAPTEIQSWIRERTGIPVGLYDQRADTVVRFREIWEVSHIDVLFVGSSHCARSFDPRVFAAEGLSSFNMGSTAQSPLNSYFLLLEHIERLRPRLALFEVYWGVMAGDGVESCLSLYSNVPLTRALFEMGLATGSMRAVNGFLLKRLDFRQSSVGERVPTFQKMDHYVTRGYVERDISYSEPRMYPRAGNIAVNSIQLKYLRKIIGLVRIYGGQSVLVVQPVPREHLRRISNYADFISTMAEFSHAAGVPLLDFNGLMNLGDEQYYFDADHLNQRGVEVFDRAVLAELKRRSLLPEHGLQDSHR